MERKGRGVCSAAGRGVSRTVAHGPPMPSLSMMVPIAQPRGKRHRARRGGATGGVLETADFGFEFAAFLLFGLGKSLVAGLVSSLSRLPVLVDELLGERQLGELFCVAHDGGLFGSGCSELCSLQKFCVHRSGRAASVVGCFQ